MFRTLAVIAAIVFMSFAPVRAQEGGGFSVKGRVNQERTWTVADLKAQSGIEVDAALQSKAGISQGAFVGVSLYTIIQQAGVVDGKGRDSHLNRTIEITARDGYTVAIALGEIDPDLEAKPVLLAYLRNGEPVDPPGSIRLVVPGDKHASRSVRDVVSIEIK